ncbi:MAG TPA: hypothetical protein VN650_00210 [Gemmatimonadaceae bacterium]|nr:hypothetical protein [Gemmatimonadaceae bacterium]
MFAASIGPGFYIGHLGTIYVGRCEVGANFSLTHNVTLGVGGRGAVRGLPRIGDNVWLGTGTIVFGDIAIGDGVAVMSGSIVSFNIPRRSLVGGNPARVLLRGYDNSTLFGGFSEGGATPVEPASSAAAATEWRGREVREHASS